MKILNINKLKVCNKDVIFKILYNKFYSKKIDFLTFLFYI
jgi:hypothetical protein